MLEFDTFAADISDWLDKKAKQGYAGVLCESLLGIPIAKFARKYERHVCREIACDPGGHLDFVVFPSAASKKLETAEAVIEAKYLKVASLVIPKSGGLIFGDVGRLANLKRPQCRRIFLLVIENDLHDPTSPNSSVDWLPGNLRTFVKECLPDDGSADPTKFSYNWFAYYAKKCPDLLPPPRYNVSRLGAPARRHRFEANVWEILPASL